MIQGILEAQGAAKLPELNVKGPKKMGLFLQLVPTAIFWTFNFELPQFQNYLLITSLQNQNQPL